MSLSTFFKSKEERNEWYRRYREQNREKIREYNREYNKRYRKEHGYANEAAWAKKNPEKTKAHKIIENARRAGKIKYKECVICKSKDTVAHHPDYSKPLEVVFVCRLHHREIHYKNTVKDISQYVNNSS